MSIQNIKKYLQQIASPQSYLKGFPICPALQNNVKHVKIYEYEGIENLHTICCMFTPFKLFSVVISMPKNWDPDSLDTLAEYLEIEYPDLAILHHHPEVVRMIGGKPAPSPGIPILIIQDKEILLKDKARLKKTGYYKAWK
jgi:hypothetical protein